MTYTEACDSLFTMLENAMFEYECECAILEEDAGIVPAGDVTSKDPAKYKIQRVLKKIWMFIKKVCKMIKDAAMATFRFVKSWVDKMTAKSTKLTINEDIQIMKITDDALKSGNVKFLNKMISTIDLSKDSTDEVRKLDELRNDHVILTAGTAICSGNTCLKIIKEIYDVFEKCDKIADKNLKAIDIADVSKLQENVENATKVKQIVGMYKMLAEAISVDIRKILNVAGTADQWAATGKGLNKVDAKQKAKAEKAAKAQNESIDTDSISALRARCLIEAAAILSEDADDANVKMDPACQQDIDDIPEEKPVDAYDYPDDTSGGEGIGDDFLDDVKDLIDDDSDALDLLTKDDNTMTIEESVNLLLDL